MASLPVRNTPKLENLILRRTGRKRSQSGLLRPVDAILDGHSSSVPIIDSWLWNANESVMVRGENPASAVAWLQLTPSVERLKSLGIPLPLSGPDRR